MFTRSSTDVLKQVSEWADQNQNVRAVILTSSRTNPNAPVDPLSDFDIELFVRNLQPFLAGDAWLAPFGAILVRWPPSPPDDGDRTTRLVMFADGLRIDFQIKMCNVLVQDVARPDLPLYYDIGYEVLLDKDGLAEGLGPPSHCAHRTKKPSESEYDAVVRTFWWDATYVATYLWRDELFFAKYMLDDALHYEYLTEVLAWHIGVEHDWTINPGAHSRWLKRYLDSGTWSSVEASFAGAGIEDNWRALFETTKLFGRLATQVGEALGYTYPHDLDRGVTEYLTQIRGLEHIGT